jgi:hypothetical protein
LLAEKCSSEIENIIQGKLKILSRITAARKSFREQFDGVSNDKDDDEEQGKESRVIIEESVLLS